MPQNRSATIPACLVSYDRARACIPEHTAHVDSIGEEVRRVCNQEYQTAFRLWIPPHVCELQQETCSQADNNPNEQTSEEVQQEYANTLEQTQQSKTSSLCARLVFLSRLEQHDGNGIVQDAFTKNDSV